MGINRYGNTAFVVDAQAPDGRWRCVSKQTDNRSRSAFSAVTVGEGDIVVIKPAPTYAVGATINHNGAPHIVAGAVGDVVELVAPDARFRHSTGTVLHIPGGNTVIVSMSDLVLEALT